MRDPDDALTIRSFRVVFQLERRLFKVDRWRVPVPYGIPLAGLAYAAAALACVLALLRLPLVGGLLHALPAPVRFVLLPVGLAYLLVKLRIDGRPAHRTLLAWVRLRLSARRFCSFRGAERPGRSVELGEITFVPDARGANYRRARISGPARVLLRYPARGWQRGRRLHVEQTSGEPLFTGKQITLRERQELVLE